MTVTWTCRCRNAQLVLREIRFYPSTPPAPEHPQWIYHCPVCGSEAVAALDPKAELHSCAPLFAWLAPAAEDDSELGGRVAGAAEVAQLGDILALNPGRDENGRRVVWQ